MDRIGRYRIVSELGRGAMGVVYHATDPAIGRPVAIKTIRLSEVNKPEEREKLRERLFREARSAGVLSHPNIVTIYDMAEENGLAYIAMEFVNGPTLDQLLSGAEAIGTASLLSFLGQAAAALDFAHQKSIVHRDIKPANIMIAEGGMVKVTDFGIAKVTTQDQFTMTGTIIGTPNYMSPEQVQGLAVDGRSDQFSLVVMAFEMLTGERPFAGEHLTTVVYKIVAEEPVSPVRLNPSLGSQIDAVLCRGLSKKPDARYLTCTEFVDALERACGATAGWKNLPRGGILTLPTVADATAPAAARPELPRPHPRAREAEEPRRRSRALPFVFAMLMVAGLIGAVAWQFQDRSAAPPQVVERVPVEHKPDPQPPPTPVAEAPKPEESKPEAREPEAAPPAPQRRAPTQPQEVSIASSPAGALAMADGMSARTCRTPCSLRLLPGKHTVLLSLPGHLAENRDLWVSDGPRELDFVTLRKASGRLMLSSTPPEASISINGVAQAKLTPAQIDLAAGTYTVTVEKGGAKKTEQVTIRDGATSFLRIGLGQ